MEVKTRVWSELEHDKVKVAAKIIISKFIACELWVEWVGTLGVVLYRNQ